MNTPDPETPGEADTTGKPSSTDIGKPDNATAAAAADTPAAAPHFQARLGLPGKVATAIATLGPLGMRMSAPGTWGSAAGWLFYAVVLFRYNNLANWATFLGVTAALVAIAILVCHISEKHLGKKDPGQIILDEFVAMPLVFIGAEGFLSRAGDYGWAWFFAGFVLFRVFDIAKPFGIKKLQRLPGGLGIVVDDLAAALAACATLHLAHLVAWFFGAP